jgi:hypothetical protein
MSPGLRLPRHNRHLPRQPHAKDHDRDQQRADAKSRQWRFGFSSIGSERGGLVPGSYQWMYRTKPQARDSAAPVKPTNANRWTAHKRCRFGPSPNMPAIVSRLRMESPRLGCLSFSWCHLNLSDCGRAFDRLPVRADAGSLAVRVLAQSNDCIGIGSL